MSVIVSTYNQIAQSPVNNSKSKMLYSFPKEERFRPTYKKQSIIHSDPPINSTKCHHQSASGTPHSATEIDLISSTPSVNCYCRQLPTTKCL